MKTILLIFVSLIAKFITAQDWGQMGGGGGMGDGMGGMNGFLNFY